MAISDILNYLKSEHEIYLGEGEVSKILCHFNSPAQHDDIHKFESELDCVLPEELKEFLLESNGMKFLTSGEMQIFGLNEIKQVRRLMEYKENILPIGYILEDYVVIKVDEIETNEYIYVGDAYCPDEYLPLHTNFKNFLDLYIAAGAKNYWRWFPIRKYFPKYNFIK